MAQVQILYLATAQGLVQLANPGTSDRWRPTGEALAGQDVVAVRASTTDPLLAFAGTARALYVTRDGGATWEQERGEGVTALAAAGDGTIFVGAANGAILQNSADGWEVTHTGPAKVVRLATLPDQRLAAVYANGQVEVLVDGVWKSGSMLVPGASEIVSSFTDPSDLFVTNATSLVTLYGSRALAGHPTGAVVLLSGKPEVLLLGNTGLLQRSEDRCANVQEVEGPTDVRVLVSPPRYQDYAYAGTGNGELWVSSDRGRTWRKLYQASAEIHDLSFARVF